MRCALYRHFDAAGLLLYIGISHDPERRFIWHKSRADWATAVKQTSYEWFPSRGQARHAEARAIASESPAHNIKNTRQLHVRGSISGLIDTWPTRQAFADAVGQKVTCVHRWAQRDRIPSEHLQSVRNAAASFGLDHVTGDWLIDSCASAGVRPAKKHRGVA